MRQKLDKQVKEKTLSTHSTDCLATAEIEQYLLNLGFHTNELQSPLLWHEKSGHLNSKIPLALSNKAIVFDNALSSVNRPIQTDIANIKHVIAVASGKGGVGKSTTTVNLARSLAAQGAKVGILDADIYGPSIPLMLGLNGKRPDSLDGKIMQPLLSNEGIKANSIGFLIQQDEAAIWRGPMASKALEQLFNESQWGDLDYLFIDLPPGTGDIQLTLAKKLPLSGAVIVSTPQDLALADAIKAHAMFNKVDVKTLGLIENMSVHVCQNCGYESHLFGKNGVENFAKQAELQLLGKAPLKLELREYMDEPGNKMLADHDFNPQYQLMALRLAIQLAELAQQKHAFNIPIKQV